VDEILRPITGSHQGGAWGACARASDGILVGLLLLSWRLRGGRGLPGGVLGRDGELGGRWAGVVDILGMLGMLMLDMLRHLWHPENEGYQTIELLGVPPLKPAEVPEGACLPLFGPAVATTSALGLSDGTDILVPGPHHRCRGL
jgi:hypothetical protein